MRGQRLLGEPRGELRLQVDLLGRRPVRRPGQVLVGIADHVEYPGQHILAALQVDDHRKADALAGDHGLRGVAQRPGVIGLVIDRERPRYAWLPGDRLLEQVLPPGQLDVRDAQAQLHPVLGLPDRVERVGGPDHLDREDRFGQVQLAFLPDDHAADIAGPGVGTLCPAGRQLAAYLEPSAYFGVLTQLLRFGPARCARAYRAVQGQQRRPALLFAVQHAGESLGLLLYPQLADPGGLDGAQARGDYQLADVVPVRVPDHRRDRARAEQVPVIAQDRRLAEEELHALGHLFVHLTVLAENVEHLVAELLQAGTGPLRFGQDVMQDLFDPLRGILPAPVGIVGQFVLGVGEPFRARQHTWCLPERSRRVTRALGRGDLYGKGRPCG